MVEFFSADIWDRVWRYLGVLMKFWKHWVYQQVTGCNKLKEWACMCVRIFDCTCGRVWMYFWRKVGGLKEKCTKLPVLSIIGIVVFGQQRILVKPSPPSSHPPRLLKHVSLSPQLQRSRWLGDDIGGFLQSLARLLLTLRRNHLQAKCSQEIWKLLFCFC